MENLWNLDNAGGHVDVATRDNDPAVRTIVGTGIGALLGALAASGFAMNAGQSAVIATVHRRSKGDVRAAYDYEPIFVT